MIRKNNIIYEKIIDYSSQNWDICFITAAERIVKIESNNCCKK